MSKIVISDPSEGTTWSGYWSIVIEDDGEVMADLNLAPELVPDINDPDELAELGETIRQSAQVAKGVEDD